MLTAKPVGRHAAGMKYDLLTALGSYALSKDKGDQRLIFRLMTLVTARYNWGRDQLAVGQREIARLWHVDERTVKREMAKLRAMGWLIVSRQGARGRVTEYSLGLDRILADTTQVWAAVGPDFETRLSVPAGTESNVVPMTPKQPIAAPEIKDDHEWSLARALLHTQDKAIYAAWFQELQREGRAGGRLRLSAPTRFHASYIATHMNARLTAACQSVDDSVTSVEVVARG
ncbi:DnaA N-terminal domain-containing protein [Pseudoprimorskyibacter insulae]|uniref:DnaA N-terminal domain-containing protein n=1 Tax=Pseudoprimorskyibacter insulae TaxID=1695997 RepID=A0A2R8B0I5_9RHOB|nr:DnaA N-terminal domain-containing protein [Pseudoprimorskyibacter insulae]SPF81770.1 hypothetical protein PRI8871_03595 [Pseudoprimorskyibacter insulae]